MTLDRILRAGGPGALAAWRRWAERRGEDWEALVIGAFGHVIPKLCRQWEHNRLTSAFLEHFGLGEDVNLRGTIQHHPKREGFWECQITAEDVGPVFYAIVNEKDNTNSDWCFYSVYKSQLALLYLTLAVKREVGSKYKEYQIDLRDTYEYPREGLWLWIWERVYIRRGRGTGRMRDMEMPMAYVYDSEAAIAYLIEKMDPKTLRG